MMHNVGGGGGTQGEGLKSYVHLPISCEKLYINPLYKYLLRLSVGSILKEGYEFCSENSISTYGRDYFLQKRWVFGKLKEKIEKSCKHIIKGAERGYVSTMWMNINKGGGKIFTHHHNPKNQVGKISGAYYLSKPVGSGNLIVHNPYPQTMPVETDDIVIFPAQLVHETEINKTSKERIVVGFNFFIK